MNVHQAVTVAEAKIRPYILETPIEYSPWLSQETGAEVWLKLEHLQRTGSFKLRGAANKLLSLAPEAAKNGIITASTGNHGAAVAYMAQKLNLPCQVFVSNEVAPTKAAAMEIYGAKLHYHGNDPIESELLARKIAEEKNIPFVSPYNDPEIVAGQGTMGLEIDRQMSAMDAVFTPVGGGGLISGTAGYLKTARPAVQQIGCQPENSAVMYESIKAGKVVDIPSMPTISDGTAGGMEHDSITFGLCQRFVDDYIMVSEEEIRAAMLFLLEKHYYLVEGAAGLSIASLRKQAADFRGKKVVLVLCGRKIGLDKLQKEVLKQAH
ncbi:MAG: threonine/serine dehydratase [Bacteroidota bacterium]